jgi:hypothetical protein
MPHGRVAVKRQHSETDQRDTIPTQAKAQKNLPTRWPTG